MRRSRYVYRDRSRKYIAGLLKKIDRNVKVCSVNTWEALWKKFAEDRHKFEKDGACDRRVRGIGRAIAGLAKGRTYCSIIMDPLTEPGSESGN